MKLNGKTLSATHASEYTALSSELNEAQVSGNKDKIVTASAALSAWIMTNCPPKRSGYASRAGKAQAAARR